ncbi:MAG: tripartite tricarboxylate transporter TctB family protein [Pseudomonadota bacterium]
MKPAVVRDVLVAALFAALALAGIFVLIPMGVVSPGSVEQAALSPAFWPKVIAWSTLAASVLLLVESIAAARGAAPAPETEEPADQDYAPWVGIVRAAALVALLFGYFASLERFGLVVPSMVLIPLIMLMFGERKALTIAIAAVALPLILYGFFRHVAGISIPLGIFG